MNENKKLYWTQGNSQPLIIPLEQEVITQEEEIVSEPYYPQEGSLITVTLVNKWFRQQFTPTLNGNLLTLTDTGTLPVGCYDVDVHIADPDGTPHFSKWSRQLVVTDDNTRTLQEWDEFKKQSVKARAAVFFFAKGDRGEKGERGEVGPAGTTDYNELANKPDLALKLDVVTEEELNEIFPLNL